jgi:hypothetical protein
MKVILALTFSGLLLSSYTFANSHDLGPGTAAVDEKYTDEIKTKESAIEKKSQDNTVKSPMYHQEDKQVGGEQKAIKKQEEREEEPTLEEKTWHRR